MRSGALLGKQGGKWVILVPPRDDAGRSNIEEAKRARKALILSPGTTEAVAFSDDWEVKTFKQPVQVAAPVEPENKRRKHNS